MLASNSIGSCKCHCYSIYGQKNQALIISLVALIPAYDMVCMVLNIALCNALNIYGLGKEVDILHRTNKLPLILFFLLGKFCVSQSTA